MMIAKSISALLAAVAFFYSTVCFSGSMAPRELMLELFKAQARIGQGDRAAVAAQAKLLGDFDALIASTPGSFWKESENCGLLVNYVLSGGQVGNVRKLLRSRDVAPEIESLLRGAVAYMSGAVNEARKLLLPLDPRDMNQLLGAQVAYVQAVLLTEQDKARASGLLDLARLLAPGGLLEEAALRRQAKLAAELGDARQFMQLASQYNVRFRRSLYADDFARAFVELAPKIGMQRNWEGVKALDRVAESFTPELRRALFLSLAREATLAGEFHRLEDLISMVSDEVKGDVAALARLKLYEGIDRLVNKQYDRASTLLGAVDAASLQGPDIELLNVSRAIARRAAVSRVDSSRPSNISNASLDGVEERARRSGDLAEKALGASDHALAGK